MRTPGEGWGDYLVYAYTKKEGAACQHIIYSRVGMGEVRRGSNQNKKKMKKKKKWGEGKGGGTKNLETTLVLSCKRGVHEKHSW